jgi:hypothetical protein
MVYIGEIITRIPQPGFADCPVHGAAGGGILIAYVREEGLPFFH